MAQAGQQIGTPGGTSQRPALFFADAAEFRAWLHVNHATATELWMGLRKKHLADPGLTWDDAVPEALCYGWIDSVVQRIDEDSRRQRWTPRKPGSNWSLVNVAHVERLTAEGRMQPAGLAAYARRRDDRTGVASFERAAEELPATYAAQLAAHDRAAAFWAAATPGYRKQVTHWVLDAKQQATRDKRMAELVADCAAGHLIKTQRYGQEPAWVARARAAQGDEPRR